MIWLRRKEGKFRRNNLTGASVKRYRWYLREKKKQNENIKMDSKNKRKKGNKSK